MASNLLAMASTTHYTTLVTNLPRFNSRAPTLLCSAQRRVPRHTRGLQAETVQSRQQGEADTPATQRRANSIEGDDLAALEGG